MKRLMGMTMLAGLMAVGLAAGAQAAPATSMPAPKSLLSELSAQGAVEQVHWRRCHWVKRCGAYRCWWVRRCHGPRW